MVNALLLHFGDPKAPSLAIIDGGPKGVYGIRRLKPRLAALMKNKKRLKNGRLPIRLVMVSHIDDDHVNGILAMANELAESTGERPYQIESLWHNSFDDWGIPPRRWLPRCSPLCRTCCRRAFSAAGAPLQHVHTGLVMASVTQGRDLRNAAKKLGWDINKEFQGKLIRNAKSGAKPIPMEASGGMTFTVLGPREAKLKALQTEWDKQRKKASAAELPAMAAAYADNSVFNLSSIIVMAESPGTDGNPRRMLLTGDARGDHILEGLEEAKLMKDGMCHVDLLKLPHHGSNRNMEASFFKKVTADHYVVSSNGDKFDNPDQDTLEWLVAARKGSKPFTVYLTYPVEEFKFKKRTAIQKDLKAFVDAGKKSGAYRVVCRDSQAPSVRVELGRRAERLTFSRETRTRSDSAGPGTVRPVTPGSETPGIASPRQVRGSAAGRSGRRERCVPSPWNPDSPSTRRARARPASTASGLFRSDRAWVRRWTRFGVGRTWCSRGDRTFPGTAL